MVEVLFGESEAASMKIAKGNILGDSRKVICLGFMLDMGNIREAMKEYVNEQKKLVEYASKGEQIRIWYSNTSHDMCGFYYACNLLKNIVNEIFVVKLPEYTHIGHNIIIEYQNWGEVLPEKLDNFIKYEKKISKTEMKMFSNHWLELVEDDSPLRAIVNGKVIGVPENFYDHLICKYLRLGPIKEIRLIGEILGHYPLGIRDWWYASRIEYMIASDRIKIVEDSNIRYGRTISLKS